MECLKRKNERKNLTHNKELGSGSLTALKLTALQFHTFRKACLRRYSISSDSVLTRKQILSP